MANTKIPSELVAINAISGTLIADNAITSVHIAENNITATQIAINAVTALQMADGTITSAKIADGTIVTADIADGQISTAKLVDSSVTQAKIGSGAVVASSIANGTITSTQMGANSVSTANIQDNAINLDKMAGLTRGSIIYGNAAGNPAYLAAGTNGHVLTSDGTDISWTADTDLFLASSGGTVTGDIIISETNPIFTLQDTDATATYNKTEFQNSGGSLNFNTRHSNGTFVSTDYQIGKNASGATEHKWTIGNTAKMVIKSSGDVKIGNLTTSATTAPLFVAKSNTNVQAIFGDNNSSIDDPSIRIIGRNTANNAIRYTFLGLDADENHGYIGYNEGSGGFVNALNFISTGRVGIGIIDPDAPLHIEDSTSSAYGGLRVVGAGTGSGSTNVRQIADFGRTNSGSVSGVWLGGRTDETTAVIGAKTASGNIAFEVYQSGWKERMRITNAGKVGIGESSPDGLLHLKGGTATGDASHILFENTQGSKVFAIGGGSTGVTNSHLYFRNVTDNTRPMVITDAGKVGIGTDAPAEKLQVKGAIGFEPSNSTNRWSAYTYTDNTFRLNYNGAGADEFLIKSDGNVGIRNTAPAATLEVGTLTSGSTGNVIINSEGGNPPALQVKSRTNRARINIQDNDTSGYIIAEGSVISIGFADAVSDNNININSSHDVGIGTDTPVAKLHIQDNTSTVYDATAYQHDLFIEKRNTAGNNQVGSIRFAVTGHDGSTTAEASIGVLQTSNAHSGNLVFGTRHSGTRAERMRITSDGNVGIGTDSPAAKLDIVGGHLRLDAGMSLQWDNSHERIEQSDGHLEFFVNNGEAMTLDTNGLGIGTTNPQHKIDAVGTIRHTSNIVSNTVYKAFSIGSNRTINDYGGLNKDYWAIQLATPGASTDGQSSGHAYGALKFSGVSGSDTTLDDVLVLNYNGNVGINCTNPEEKLTIDGGVKIANSNKRLYFGTEGSTSHRALEGSVDGNVIQVGEGYTNVLLGSASAKVGIRQTSPDAMLHIDGATSSIAGLIIEGNTNGDVISLQMKAKANNGTLSYHGLTANPGSDQDDNTISLGNGGGNGVVVDHQNVVTARYIKSHGGGTYAYDVGGSYLGANGADFGTHAIFRTPSVSSPSSGAASTHFLTVYSSGHWGEYPVCRFKVYSTYFTGGYREYLFRQVGGTSYLNEVTAYGSTTSWGPTPATITKGSTTDSGGVHSGQTVYRTAITLNSGGAYQRDYVVTEIMFGANRYYSSANNQSQVDALGSQGGKYHFKTISLTEGRGYFTS